MSEGYAQQRPERLRIGILLAIGISPQMLNGFYNPHLLSHKTWFWAVDIFTLAVMPLAIYLWGTRKNYFSSRDLGFHLDLPGVRSKAVFIASMLIMPLVIYYGYWFFKWLGAYGYFLLFEQSSNDFVFDFSMAVGGEGPIRIIKILYFSLSAGLMEELYYRGMFKLLFKPDRLGAILFMLISAVIFSLIHWEGGIVKMFATLCLGLILAGAYLINRSLWPLVFGHFVGDFFLFYIT